MRRQAIEDLFLKKPRGAMSRVRLLFYRALGLHAGIGNRIEAIRCRRLSLVSIGNYNALSEGCWLWPEDSESDHPRIVIGNGNYFNRDVMIDACGHVRIGDDNMLGPGVYITDSNHTITQGTSPKFLPMNTGIVRIGNGCWIGARSVILKNVQLDDYCVVAAGAVVTHSFPGGSVIAGVPAKLIRTIGSAAQAEAAAAEVASTGFVRP